MSSIGRLRMTGRGRPQRWLLIAPRLETLYPLHPASYGYPITSPNNPKFLKTASPTSALFDSNIYPPLNAWSLLAIPPLDVKAPLPTYGENSRASNYSVEVSVSTLESLPTELLTLVLGFLPSNQDILTLGLSSPFLWTSVLSHIFSVLLKSIGLFAGTPIALIGTRTRLMPPSFPLSFFATSSESTAESMAAKAEIVASSIHHAENTFRTLLSKDIGEEAWTTSWIDIKKATFHRSSSKFYKNSSLEWRLTRSLYSSFRALRGHYTNSNLWYLRNLSRKQFVKARLTGLFGNITAYVPLPKELNVYGYRNWNENLEGRSTLTIDDVLIMKLSWSPIKTCRFEPNRLLECGEWAGDCLDMVSTIPDTWESDHREDYRRENFIRREDFNHIYETSNHTSERKDTEKRVEDKKWTDITPQIIKEASIIHGEIKYWQKRKLEMPFGRLEEHEVEDFKTGYFKRYGEILHGEDTIDSG